MLLLALSFAQCEYMSAADMYSHWFLLPYWTDCENTKPQLALNNIFFWSGKDDQSCPQCQMISFEVPSKAPLSPLLIIGIPFECLGMDIIGSVEKSKTGNRCMLVITDYATKYPEVFPLKSINAKSMACTALLKSRVSMGNTDQPEN